MMNHRRRTVSTSPKFWTARIVLVALFVVTGFTLAAPAPDSAPELRYRWKEGQTHAYRVAIEVDYGDYTETLSGTPLFEVRTADQDGIKVTFRGSLTERNQLKPGKRGIIIPRPRFGFSPFTGVGSARTIEMTINDRGEVISDKGTAQLPYLLGNLPQLVLEQMPKQSEKTWKVSRELSIVQSDSGLPRPFPLADDRARIKATHETTYTVTSTTDDAVTLQRTVAMATAELVGGKPRIEIVGDGTLTFDRKLGCPSKLEAKQRLLHREGDKVVETSMTISYARLTDAERAELSKTTEGTVLFPSEPLTEALAKQSLDDLRSGDKLRQLKALVLLGSKDPPKANKEMSQALEELLASKEAGTRFNAARALARWATEDSAPALLKALEAEDLLVRHGAMDALARLKSKGAAEAVAKRVGELQDRRKAAQTLQAMGAEAEPAALKLVEHADWQVRNEACNVLATVGTDKSVSALEALRDNDSNALVKSSARKALEAIQKRK